MVPAGPAEQPVIRDNAIALLVEKLREIGSQAHAQYASEARRLANIGSMGSQEWLNRRESALTQYALSDRCEQLTEQIEAALLFEELDNAERLAENNELPRPGDRVRITGDSPHLGDLGTLIAFGPISHDVLLDKDRNLGSGGIRLFAPEELVWLKPEGAESEAAK